jgi:DedD protein
VTSSVKERLTGALILIVAVVIVVPELFSGRAQQRPSTDAPDAQSAADGPPLRSYTMELGGTQPQGTTQGQAELAPEPAAAPTLPEVTEVPEAVAGQPALEHPVPVESPAASVPEVVPAARGWWVQLGSFSARANADRLRGTLSAAGYPVVVSPTMSKGKELFRVRAGPAADREAAVALQSRLDAAGHKGSLVAPQ